MKSTLDILKRSIDNIKSFHPLIYFLVFVGSIYYEFSILLDFGHIQVFPEDFYLSLVCYIISILLLAIPTVILIQQRKHSEKIKATLKRNNFKRNFHILILLNINFIGYVLFQSAKNILSIIGLVLLIVTTILILILIFKLRNDGSTDPKYFLNNIKSNRDVIKSYVPLTAFIIIVYLIYAIASGFIEISLFRSALNVFFQSLIDLIVISLVVDLLVRTEVLD